MLDAPDNQLLNFKMKYTGCFHAVKGPIEPSEAMKDHWLDAVGVALKLKW